MNSRFLALGEAMVEMAPTPDGTFKMGFAGDTLNTAWYARKCLPGDWNVSYFTAVGTDKVSDRLVAFLKQSGLETDRIVRRSDKTVGLYMIQLENGERSFAYWRSDSAARKLAEDKALLAAALDGVKLAYLSGISLAILSETDRETLLEELTTARARGVKIAFDPNLRPRLWADQRTMCETVMNFAGLCDFLMPSFEDEEAYFGDATPRVSVDRYLAAGAKMVVVKNGPEDVVCAGPDGILSFTPDPVKDVVDTTAAGDSFNAAFLASYLVENDLPKAVAAGAKLAARVIGARGALVDVLDRV